MHIVTAILHRDHCILHFRGQLINRKPTAEARAKRLDDRAVGGTYADHLPIGRCLQIFKAVDFAACYGDENTKHHDTQKSSDNARFDDTVKPRSHWASFFRNLACACHPRSVNRSWTRRQAASYSGSKASAALLMQ